MKHKDNPKYLVWSSPLVAGLVLIVTGLLLVACGGSSSTAANTSDGPTPTSALAATPISTHVFQQPTSVIKVAEKEESGTPSAAEADLSRGERIYQNRGCADCHGSKGEGVTGKAEKLAGTQLTAAEFTNTLRTGGKGELGNDHLYGPQAISPSGMETLYAFIKSFQ